MEGADDNANANIIAGLALLPNTANVAQLVAELGNFGGVICAACAGLGHSAWECATAAKAQPYLNVAVAQVVAHGVAGLPQGPRSFRLNLSSSLRCLLSTKAESSEVVLDFAYVLCS